MSNTQVLNSSTEPFYLVDSYLRIVDFSEPVDPSKDSIDISTDRITTAIRLPDNVPRLYDGVLWISNRFLYMLPGEDFYDEKTADEYGNDITMTTPDLKNKVWTFNLDSHAWNVQVSGLEEEYNNPQLPAIAFDTKTQVLWYYGGLASHELYRVDRGVATPIEVETDSSLVGVVSRGMLVYIESAGNAGILVLLGGIEGISHDEKQPVSMMEQIVNHSDLLFG